MDLYNTLRQRAHERMFVYCNKLFEAQSFLSVPQQMCPCRFNSEVAAAIAGIGVLRDGI